MGCCMPQACPVVEFLALLAITLLCLPPCASCLEGQQARFTLSEILHCAHGHACLPDATKQVNFTELEALL